MYDIAVGFTCDNLDHVLKTLPVDRRIDVATAGGDHLVADLGPPQFKLKLATALADMPRLVLRFTMVTFNGETLPAQPWQLSLKVRLTLTTITPSEWAAHQKLDKSSLRKLKAYSDQTRFDVKVLSVDFGLIDIAAALQERESQFPAAVSGAQRLAILAALGQYLRTLTGPQNPFNLGFQALSKVNMDCALANLEPTHADWGVSLAAADPQRSQLRFLMMIGGRTPPPPPVSTTAFMITRPRDGLAVRGSLVFSQEFFAERLVATQVQRWLGFQTAFVRSGEILTNQMQRSSERVEQFYVDGILQTVTFAITDRLQTSISARYQADLRLWAVMATTAVDRETYATSGLLDGDGISLQSWLTTETGVCLDAVAGALVSRAMAPSVNSGLAPETSDRLDRWRQASVAYHQIADHYQNVVTDFASVIFDTKALAVRLSPERLMFLDPAWYAFSDPVLRRDTGIMGLGSLTFDLDLVRKT